MVAETVVGDLTVHDRIQFLAGSLLSWQSGDASASRGQAIATFGQALGQPGTVIGDGGALAALAAMLLLAACGVVLFRGSKGYVDLSALSHRIRAAGAHASRPLAGLAVMLAIGLVAAPVRAAPGASPVGTWWTANGHGVIAIEPCGAALCGSIVGIDRKPTEPMPTDVKGRSQCGLTIITNERPDGDGTWVGQITDPRDGSTYDARLRVDEQGSLRLHAYLGIPLLGATQTWHRFSGQLTASCGLA